IYAAPVGVRLYDIAKDGRVLLASSEFSFQVNVSLNGEGERDLSWLGWSDVRDISPDGRSLLLSYSGEGSSTNYDVYVRATDGKDPTHIGEGQAQQFSPDGRSVLSVVHGPPARLTILPTGPGDARTAPTGNVTSTSALWRADGRQLLIVGTEPGKRLRAYVTDVNGATPRPI